MTDTPVDTDVLRELEEATGADFVAELVETFFEEAQVMIGDLRQALATGDADAWRRAAHSIKSNAGVFGANGLAEMARSMELSGMPGDAQGAADAIDGLEAEYQRTRAALRDMTHG